MPTTKTLNQDLDRLGKTALRIAHERGLLLGALQGLLNDHPFDNSDRRARDYAESVLKRIAERQEVADAEARMEMEPMPK